MNAKLTKLLSVGLAVVLLTLLIGVTSQAIPSGEHLSDVPSALARGDTAGAPPDVASAGSFTTTVFQRWVSPHPYYAGVAETYMDMYYPDANYGGSGTMKLHSGAGGRQRLLVKFDISSIPSTATVEEATLTLFAWYRSPAYRVTANAYRIERHWNEDEATWNHATAADFWSLPGCGDPIYDYDPTPVAATSLNYTNQHYSWDVKDAVQQWIADPLGNEGLLIISEGYSAQYQFRTSDVYAENVRPSLMVTYYTGEPTPTPVPTSTETATPTASATPTQTPLHSPTPVNTQTNTPTLTPVQSPTNTATPTVTPTNTPTSTPVHLAFQQDVYPDVTYSGVSDTFLASYRPDASWGGYDSLRIGDRDPGAERSLIHFDLQGHIPTNAQITSARLSLFAWSRRAVYGIKVTAYGVTRDWDASQATWNAANTSDAWGSPGCDEVDADRQADPVNSQYVYSVNQLYEWDVRSAVEDWVADPSTNNGLLLVGYDVNQEVRFRSSEWYTPQQRPKLTIVYTLP